MSNMAIWDAVSETDPSHTKKVNQRGGFTAIDAHYQIMNATKQFGPVGVGWGYDVIKLERMDQFVIAHVQMWHGDRTNCFGPVLGCSEMFGNRPDGDAPKKATTDAITKGLSQLGFNADVFLGKFDDNKYVEEQKRKNTKPDPREIAALKADMLGAVNGSNDMARLSAIEGDDKFDADLQRLREMEGDAAQEVIEAIEAKKKQLKPKAA